MACGTGKTLTSQRIAERYAGKGSSVLVLVPSISLLNQSVLAWNYDSDENLPMKSYAVCSDKTVGRKDYPDEDMNLSDLVIPPTTDAESLITSYTPDSEAMSVIFSTYQSLQVIHDAQALGLPEFTLIICDEAHRTAGTAASGSRSAGGTGTGRGCTGRGYDLHGRETGQRRTRYARNDSGSQPSTR